MNAVNTDGLIPGGPEEKYRTAQELLSWLDKHVSQFGEIYRASIYGATVYVLSSPAYAEHVLLDNWQNYARKGQAVKRIALSLGNGLISSNGDFWVRQRRMVQPTFNRRSIDAFAAVISEANAALLMRWRGAAEREQRVNVTRDVSLLTLEITLRILFGPDYERIAPRFAIVADESRNIEFAKELSTLGRIVIEVIGERRDAGRTEGDMLATLMLARDRESGQTMPDAQLAREVLTLIVAGHETTASVLNWIWYLLARHPRVESRLAEELDTLRGHDLPAVDVFPRFAYTRRVIEEALRLYPPLWLMTRKAVRNDRLGDYFVPAGTEIYISPYLLQRHPALWAAPELFEPDRFLPENSRGRQRLASCPFGAGPRNCIGEHLARLELQIHLMIQVPELKMQHPQTEPAQVVAGMNLLSKSDFFMSPDMRVATPTGFEAAGATEIMPAGRLY